MAYDYGVNQGLQSLSFTLRRFPAGVTRARREGFHDPPSKSSDQARKWSKRDRNRRCDRHNRSQTYRGDFVLKERHPRQQFKGFGPVYIVICVETLEQIQCEPVKGPEALRIRHSRTRLRRRLIRVLAFFVHRRDLDHGQSLVIYQSTLSRLSLQLHL